MDMLPRFPLASKLLVLVVGCVLSALQVVPAGEITSPKELFGFNLGDDYCLANYRQLAAHWRKLDQQSDRVRVEVIGQSEEGREMLMAVITSPANQAQLPRYQEISRRLALAEGLSDKEARRLAAEGKAVVWIDGGLHATETVGSQQLMETVYQMARRTDEEMQRFLNDVIVLCCCPNPDGLDLVADWYMRHEDPKRRSLSHLPRLYQKYVGHDNNRDFYMVTQKETEAVCRVFYQEWFPQIVYNHHQSGPAGTVLFAPPFRDPFNYHFDPLIPLGVDLVGAAMHSRFVAEGKPGSTMRGGANYSTWYNGGLRTTVYFHNMIGLLTEIVGSPTPMEIPLQVQRQLPKADLPYPIAPQSWRFRQSIEYSLTANWAVIDLASRHREQFLWNAYRMGKNSIERGSRDCWTIGPGRIQAAEEAWRQQQEQRAAKPAASAKKEKAKATQPRDIYQEVLHHPAFRDPRGYILPSHQPDFLTATKFVNALIRNGVTVHRATASFDFAGKTYPPGSYVVKAAQAFRPHILDMFEPQDHPHDVLYPGGPPVAPYDMAGWTLAYQMGVQFDRILDGFSGPFERIEGLAKPPAGVVSKPEDAAGFLLDRATNDSFVAVNRLLRKGLRVQWLREPMEQAGATIAAGTWYIPNKGQVLQELQRCAADLGLTFLPVSQPPQVPLGSARPVRIGLWDQYGGSMTSGWLRWLLERFEFDFRLAFAPDLDKGSLAERYDVLILPSGAVGASLRSAGPAPDKKSIPAEYHERVGGITADKTLPQLKAFLDQGGTILAIGGSTALARHLGIPVLSALTEMGSDGKPQPLGREKFYTPGSVLQVRVDPASPLAYGLPEHVDVMFVNSPAFRLTPQAVLQGVRPVAWFDSEKPLRSGWSWGQHYLKDAIAVAEVPAGQGRLCLFGPEITFRAQPHGSFKFLFNGIYLGKAGSHPIQDGVADGQGGGGRGRRSITDVDDSPRFLDEEIIDHGAVRGNRLRPDAGPPRNQLFAADFGH